MYIIVLHDSFFNLDTEKSRFLKSQSHWTKSDCLTTVLVLLLFFDELLTNWITNAFIFNRIGLTFLSSLQNHEKGSLSITHKRNFPKNNSVKREIVRSFGLLDRDSNPELAFAGPVPSRLSYPRRIFCRKFLSLEWLPPTIPL